MNKKYNPPLFQHLNQRYQYTSTENSPINVTSREDIHHILQHITARKLLRHIFQNHNQKTKRVTQIVATQPRTRIHQHVTLFTFMQTAERKPAHITALQLKNFTRAHISELKDINSNTYYSTATTDKHISSLNPTPIFIKYIKNTQYMLQNETREKVTPAHIVQQQPSTSKNKNQEIDQHLTPLPYTQPTGENIIH